MPHNFAFYFLFISCGGRQSTSLETDLSDLAALFFLSFCHQVSVPSSERSASRENTAQPCSEHASAPRAVSSPAATGQSSGGGPDNRNRIFTKAEDYYNKTSKSKL